MTITSIGYGDIVPQRYEEFPRKASVAKFKFHIGPGAAVQETNSPRCVVSEPELPAPGF